MAATVADRVQKRRTAMRMAGLRPVQIWVPDTRQPNFANECLRQSKLVSQAESPDVEIQDLMNQALTGRKNLAGSPADRLEGLERGADGMDVPEGPLDGVGGPVHAAGVDRVEAAGQLAGEVKGEEHRRPPFGP